MERFIPVEIFRKTVITLEVLSACNLYGNFGENFPSNGISIFFFCHRKQERERDLYQQQQQQIYFLP